MEITILYRNSDGIVGEAVEVDPRLIQVEDDRSGCIKIQAGVLYWEETLRIQNEGRKEIEL